MKRPNYNNPIDAVKIVTNNANKFLWSYSKFWRQSRCNVGIRLLILGVGVFGAQLLLKQGFAVWNIEHLRPYFQTGIYAALSWLAFSPTTSDLILDRRIGYRGTVNTHRALIGGVEDIIQGMSERGFYPYSNEFVEYDEDDVIDVPSLPSPGDSPSLTGYGETKLSPGYGEPLPPASPERPKVENLAETIAARNHLPVQIVGGTGSGKTTLLQHIIYESDCYDTEYYIFDAKPSDSHSFLGLKYRNDCYFAVRTEYDIPQFADELARISNLVNDPSRNSRSKRILLISDELNNAIAKANLYETLQKSLPTKDRDTSKYTELIKQHNLILLSQGRERNVLGISTTHEATVATFGGSSGSRSNQRFVVLGSLDSPENVSMVLHDRGAKIIPDSNVRESLLEQYNAWTNLLNQPNVFYAITNVGGHWRLVILPSEWDEPLPEIFDREENEQQETQSLTLNALEQPIMKRIEPFDKREHDIVKKVKSILEYCAECERDNKAYSPSYVIKMILGGKGSKYNNTKVFLEDLERKAIEKNWIDSKFAEIVNVR